MHLSSYDKFMVYSRCNTLEPGMRRTWRGQSKELLKIQDEDPGIRYWAIEAMTWAFEETRVNNSFVFISWFGDFGTYLQSLKHVLNKTPFFFESWPLWECTFFILFLLSFQDLFCHIISFSGIFKLSSNSSQASYHDVSAIVLTYMKHH